jgi:NAD-dependent deacetylase
MAEIHKAVEACDVFIVVGSSGQVHPANHLVVLAEYSGAHTILINLEEPENHSMFHEIHLGRAEIILPKLVAKWIDEI